VLAWQDIDRNPALSYHQKAAALEKMLPALRYDAKFLVAYGELLSQDSACLDRAIVLLEQSKRYFLSYRSIVSTANACRYAMRYPQAIDNYRFLACYVPSRFSPKYELMKLYLKQRDTGEAKIMAKEIRAMPVKIPSPEVDFMRAEALHYLHLLPDADL
jgi:hypothetical protein